MLLSGNPHAAQRLALRALTKETSQSGSIQEKVIPMKKIIARKRKNVEAAMESRVPMIRSVREVL